MKRLRMLSILLSLIVALSGSVWAESADAQVAYLDVAKVFDDYQKTKDQDALLQTAGEEKTEARETLVGEIRALKDEMALLSDDAKKKKEGELNEKIQALRDFDMSARRELEEKRAQMMQEIFEDIDKIVQETAKSKQLDFVFNQRVLVFAGDQYDITTDVAQALDKKYAQEKK